ncbi:class I SAM-dependent methyltransferase [Patescibacteria group bacterium]|nr:class I SAM-dependent methyltransferase [Patescibacteria group bacterium]
MSDKYIGIEKYLKDKRNIFDVGTGPNGSDWWSKSDTGSNITGCDIFFFPKKISKNITIFKYDASKLNRLNKLSFLPVYKSPNKFQLKHLNLVNKFDFVVANHVLEHVSSPSNLIKGISKLIKKDGLVYIGFPESTNFTDIFYHLIHSEGGGHIQKLTKNFIENLFKQNGFKTLHIGKWPDDWLWFEKQFDFKGRNIKYINQKEIKYLADVFRKELTLKKGYFYGWEMVFKKL